MAVVEDCLFCAIAGGKIPASIVYEDELIVAFRDIAPVAPTHVLVVPRSHLADATVLGSDHGQLLAAVFAAATKIADDEGIVDSGYRLVFNVGEDAGNSVPHLHLHVIGGRGLAWPPG